ncbi:hypothetical protein [Arachidicoccus sp.]
MRGTGGGTGFGKFSDDIMNGYFKKTEGNLKVHAKVKLQHPQ